MLRTLATSSLALIVGASPVFADVTPAQVWESLSRYYTDSGYTVTVGEETETDNGLELSNVELSMNIAGEDEASSDAKFIIPKLTFTETENASVKSVMEGDATISVDVTPPEAQAPAEGEAAEGQSPEEAAEEFPLDIVLSVPGNETISSGTPEDIRHEYNFPTVKLSMKMDETVEEGAEAADIKLLGNLTLNQVTGWTTLKEGETWQMEQDIAAESLVADLSVTETPKESAEPEQADETEGEAAPKEPKGPVTFTAQANMETVKTTGKGTTPKGQTDLASRLDTALEAGLDLTGTIEYGATAGNFNIEGSGTGGAPKPANGKFSSEGGSLTFGMSKAGLSYSGGSKASEFEMSLADLPFPFNYAVDSSAFDFTFPVSKSEEAQPFTLSYALTGLTLGDGIWNLFDPESKLPRDPANLAIDLEGMGLVQQNLFDPTLGQQMQEQAEQATEDAEKAEGETDTAESAPMPPVPFLPQSLKIKNVSIDAVGAQADLTGDLTFPEGAQAPLGKISGDFNGINALLDKLVEAKLLPQEQVMGARMMMTMFAKPVEGQEDQLQSEIEFKEDGSILANGQRIK